MGIKIVALNERNEPFNLNYANINEEIFFFWEPDPINVPVNLTGDERWVLNFDSGNTSGLAADTIIQEIVGFSEPLGVVFTRPGTRSVNYKVYDDFTNSSTSFLLFEDSISFPLFEFPDEIEGPEFISFGGVANYFVNSNFTAQKYEWYVNGFLDSSNTNTLSLTFNNIVKASIRLRIVNGKQTKNLEYLTLLSVGNASFGNRYEGNVKDNLLFFNKEGDNLNFEYVEDDNGQEYWDGDMIFHLNSNDTFKTIGLYTLEKVNPIGFKSDNLNLRKMQLFNEYGMDFHPSYSGEIEIESVEIVNKQSGFYTKWLNSPNIHLNIPIGSEIILKDFYHIEIDDSIPSNPILTNFEIIQDLNSASTSGGYNTFTVVDARKNSIMIISETENTNYNKNYGFGEFRLQTNSIQEIPKGKVESINLIKIIDSQKYNTEWNEPSFKSQFYDRKKLTLVNSQRNDGVYTVNYPNDDISNDFNDKIFKIECIDINTLIPNPIYGFRVKLDFKTNKILLSNSAVDFIPESTNSFLNDKNILIWESTLTKDFTPPLLKVGRTFFFEQLDTPESNLNNLFETINVNSAGDILTPQTTDEDGWKLTLRDYDNIDNIYLEFILNNTTTYSFTESIDWEKGDSIEEAAFALSELLNNSISNVSTINVGDEVWIWEIGNNNINLVNENDIDTSILSWQSGVLLQNNPEYGIVGDAWVKLDISAYTGYIHHRVEQGNYHILNYTGVAPNEVANWYTLPINKKVVQVEQTNTIEYKENLVADAYLEETTLFFEQPGDTKNSDVISEELIQRFIGNNRTAFSQNGLDVYVDGSNFCISRLYPINSIDEKDDYIDVTLQQPEEVVYGTNSTFGQAEWVNILPQTETQNIEIFSVLETLQEEYNHNFGLYERPRTISNIWERKIKIEDIDAVSGFNININGIDYPITYDDISVSSTTPEEDQILDVEETLLDWGNARFAQNEDIAQNGFDPDEGKKYHVVLEEQGILTWLEKSGESVVNNESKFDTLVLQSKYPNVTINYDVNGTLDMHKIRHSDVTFYEMGDRLTITINNTTYTTNYNGSMDATLSEWVDTYSETLLLQDVIVDFDEGLNGTTGFVTTSGSAGYSFSVDETSILKFSTLEERTQLNMQIWVGKTPVPGRDLYTIKNYRKGNQGIILSGNEVLAFGVDLQSLGFSTAMITSIKNSKFALNNQEYNLLFVDPNILGLSYQGPFWNNNDSIGWNYLRSDFSFDFYDDTGVPPRIKFLTESVDVGHMIEDITHNDNPPYQIAIGGNTMSVIEYDSETVLHQTSGLTDITDIQWNKYATTSGDAGLINIDYVNNRLLIFNSSDFSYNAIHSIQNIISPSAILTDFEILESLVHLYLDMTNNRIYMYDTTNSTLLNNFDMGSTYDPVSIALANVYNGIKNSVAVLCELTEEIRFYDVQDSLHGTSGNSISFDTSISIPFTPRNMIQADYHVWSNINTINDKHLIIIGDNEIAFVNRVSQTLINTLTFTSNIVDSEIGYKDGDLDYLWILTLEGVYEIDIRTQLIKNTYADGTTYSSVIYNDTFKTVFLTDTFNDRVLAIDAETYKKLRFFNTGVSPSQLINNAYVDGKIDGPNDRVYVKNADQTVTVIIEDTSFVSGSTSGYVEINNTSGTSGNVISDDSLELLTREYLRYPRERLDGDNPIIFRFSWEEIDDEDVDSSMFYYDFSGNQLDPKFRNEGVYQYVGEKPLINNDDVAYLNTKPNRNKKDVTNKNVQQTVFEEIYHELLLVDSEEEVDPTPYPLQTFIGYRSDLEGVNSRTALLHRIENIELDIVTKLKDDNNPSLGWINIINFNENNYLTNTKTDINFIESGFKVGQRVTITGQDYINENNAATFKNSGFRGEITKVTVNRIDFLPLDRNMKSQLSLTKTRNLLPPFRERDAAFSMKLVVEPELIAKINIKGQTDIEDERYKVMLDNFGKNITHNEIFLFKDYDIKESGIDWVYLNQKRKEMLTVYPEIYNYLGSYKAVINAINYFGHNDLEFYEYYLNVDENSIHFDKLHKIEIPDIFNNRIDGFTPNDFILKSLPNEKYEKTKLFNLTYRITDKEGNIVLAYSLEEVIIKLLGLKKWLQENVIPVGNRILDLTGRGESVGTTNIWHDVKEVRKYEVTEDLTVIDFKTEGYLQPVENNSKTYNIHIEFFTNSDIEIPDYYQLKIQTFSAKPNYSEPDFELRAVQNINIYKTDMKSYNFTADLNTDPFIMIETICDNGYGANWTQRKTYSLVPSGLTSI